MSVAAVAQGWGAHLVVFHGEVQNVIKSTDSCWGVQAQRSCAEVRFAWWKK